MQSVRIKVYCRSKLLAAHQGGAVSSADLILYPVTFGSEENKQFFLATPSGRIEFSTVNLPAAASFEPGVEYYVDITPANPAPAVEGVVTHA